jgi:hypothetical protein
MQRDGAQLGKACNSLLSVGRLTPSIMDRLLEKSWAFTENDLALGPRKGSLVFDAGERDGYPKKTLATDRYWRIVLKNSKMKQRGIFAKRRSKLFCENWFALQ